MTFAEKVYEITKKIPRGKVATYKQIATLAGNPKAARAVGVCLKINPYAPIVPCHRVVASNGLLTGYSAGRGLKTKKNLLLSEGVTFTGDKINLTKHAYAPE